MNLSGKHRPGNVGLLHLWMFKHDMGEILVEKATIIDPMFDAVKQMRLMLAPGGHDFYQEWKESKDIAMASNAQKKALRFFEDIVFLADYDNKGIKVDLKNGGDPKDVFTRDNGVASEWQDVAADFKQEAKRYEPDPKDGDRDGETNEEVEALERGQIYRLLIEECYRHTESEGASEAEVAAERARVTNAFSLVKLPDESLDDGDVASWVKYILRVVDETCSWVIDHGKDTSQDALAELLQKNTCRPRAGPQRRQRL